MVIYSLNHMYTGSAVIDLDTVPPTVLCPVGLTAFEGTSTWSDPITGDLRFFTDGISVWNISRRYHEHRITPDSHGSRRDQVRL